uniref:Flavin-containing monooxygenase n=1 Tax=Kalanchoe fedtschenkoi TaxID=63787 RepID=A0A7N0T3Y8_KALFE
MQQQHQQVIVVGAGPSGLAVAACLGLNSIPYVLLERDDCYAPIWKKKSYDRLNLHLAKQFCELPDMSFSPKSPTYLSKNEFVQYLDEYVTRFHISPVYRRSVELAEFDEESKLWHVKVRKVGGGDDGVFEEFTSTYLVVASGETANAFIPEVEGLADFQGEVIHSTQYKNGKEFEKKSVLVVGSGNSGMEIALDLANFGAKTSIVVRSPTHVLSRGMAYIGLVLFGYLPFHLVDSFVAVLSKLRCGDLSKYGIKRPDETPFLMKEKYSKYPVIDVGTIKKIKSGEIQVLPAMKSVRGGQAEFENGKSHPFDVIIFATGFKRSTCIWLKGDDYLLNEEGLPKPHFPDHWKGEKGLYCCGLSRRGLYGICLDAKSIADDINKSRLNTK